MHLEIWQLILLAALGALAGVLNVVAGGGSLLTLPTMILMGVPTTIANGTNRVAILAQNVTAVSGFRLRGYSHFRLSMSLMLAAVPGAIAGAHAGALIRGDWFNRILAVVMIGVIVLMASKRSGKSADHTQAAGEPLSRTRLFWGHAAMVGVGFYGGFIQAGVGFLLMAALHRVMRLDLVQVNMHKVFIVGGFTLAALLVFLAHGKVWWIPGLCLALGNSIGGFIGAQLTITRGETFIRRVLYAAVAAMAVKLLLG